jgi:polysaccharide biosynthesis/export protein
MQSALDLQALNATSDRRWPRVHRYRVRGLRALLVVAVCSGLVGGRLAAQSPPAESSSGTGAPRDLPAGVATPAGYKVGTDDVLTVVFWRDKDMSGDVVVRPDGKISVPLINDIQAAGLTPEQLRANLEAAAAKLVRDPKATVVVKQINSMKVFITGQVAKPGGYTITAPITVLQLIALAGGLREYADLEHIVIVRAESGQQTSFRFNYKEMSQQKRIGQNMELRAGDTVLVP